MEVGYGMPGAGSRRSCPGRIFCVVGSTPIGKPVVSFNPPYGLSSNIHAIPSSPRLYFWTIEKSESPSCTLYVNGAEKVAVGVIVGVSVGVVVDVGVDVLVGVKVRVGVDVSVAKKVLIGLLGPVNQTISRIIPPKTSTPAMIKTRLGPRRCLRFRRELILLDGEDEIGGLLFMKSVPFTLRLSKGDFPLTQCKIILPEN